ncbi:hypothetical protein NMG60_11015431 [Bertholletia excelsa]
MLLEIKIVVVQTSSFEKGVARRGWTDRIHMHNNCNKEAISIRLAIFSLSSPHPLTVLLLLLVVSLFNLFLDVAIENIDEAISESPTKLVGHFLFRLLPNASPFFIISSPFPNFFAYLDFPSPTLFLFLHSRSSLSRCHWQCSGSTTLFITPVFFCLPCLRMSPRDPLRIPSPFPHSSQFSPPINRSKARAKRSASLDYLPLQIIKKDPTARIADYFDVVAL